MRLISSGTMLGRLAEASFSARTALLPLLSQHSCADCVASNRNCPGARLVRSTMSSVAARKLLDRSVLRCAGRLRKYLVGFAVILMAGWLLQLGDVAANAVGYGCGLLLSFVLNRQLPFATRGVPPALVRYLLAFAVSYGVNVGVLVIFTAVLGQSSVLSQALAVCSYTIAFYALSRWVVFA